MTAEIAAQLAAHPDHHIFTSLPRTGRVRAARLLSEIGDCRARFPTPESLAGLAGVAPVTRRPAPTSPSVSAGPSITSSATPFCDFAGDSRQANPWAADLYGAARARGHDHPHAVRILARAWLFVLWHCWQDNTTYDPDPTPSPATPTQPRSPSRGLTQGISLLLSTAGARFPDARSCVRTHEHAVSQSGFGVVTRAIAPSVTAVLKIAREHVDAMIAHARDDHPDEACGVIVGPEGSDVPTRLVRMINAERSPTFFRFDPRSSSRYTRK